MTVTATASGGTGTCAALTVRVLTGAAGAQPGAVHEGTEAPPEVSFTPQGSGSIVYGSILTFPLGTFTPDAQTTLISGDSGAGGCAYGTVRSTAPTAAGTPVTLGVTSPAGQFNGWALAEVLAAGTLQEDASQPPPLTSGFLPALTTDTFTPPAGALLVAMGVAVANAIAVSDSLGLTWTLLATENQSTIWAAQLPAPPAAAAAQMIPLYLPPVLA
jgi:hypothetical protein